MTFRIVVCHISFLKFEYFTQRRGEQSMQRFFTTQILMVNGQKGTLLDSFHVTADQDKFCQSPGCF